MTNPAGQEYDKLQNPKVDLEIIESLPNTIPELSDEESRKVEKFMESIRAHRSTQKIDWHDHTPPSDY